ncbi:MAG: hypothetical protein ACMUHU_07720 [Thermoplasmatota archaeon]
MRSFQIIVIFGMVIFLLLPVVFAQQDSDGDGMSDEDELKYGLDPEDPSDAFMDTDGDGYTNKQELDTGTDPVNCNSYPGLENRRLVITAGVTNFGIIRAGENRTFPLEVTAIDGHFEEVTIEVVEKSVFEVTVEPPIQKMSRDATVEFLIMVKMPLDGLTGNVSYSILLKAVSGDIESNEERIYFGEEGEIKESPGLGTFLILVPFLVVSLLIYRKRSRR